MFKNKSGLTKHTCTQHSRATCNRQKFHQPAPRVRSPSSEARSDYDHLDFGLKCDAEGNLIDQNAPPPPQTDTSPDNWTPYESHIAFEMAEFLFSWNQTSAKQIDTLLDLWTASLIKHNDAPPFTGHHDLYNTIDATPLGDIPWETFTMSYNGAKSLHDIPPWMDATYDVWFRDPRLLLHDMLGNPDFDGQMEYVPHRDYSTEDTRCFKNFFSSDWAWDQADIIAQNEANHGSTFVLLIISSDKMTVSVATGHTKYHLLYMSIGNISNSTRHAHRNGVVLVGFLTIPKTMKEHAGDTAYRNFRRQMFHSSLVKIFEAIKPYMDTPNVAHFPDGHFCRVIYGLGPYIADYPEQALLSGVVQGWCPKCLADRRDLDGDEPCLCRCEKHRELLVEELEYGKLWEEYGIVGDVVPFTNDYPQADIHELISPDILHQIIEGAFKDHLVDWVESYLKITHGASHAAQIMDDIDNRIAAVSSFAGLRRFPEGHGFKQWTGDDSKALMKVYLPAIRGHVPDDVVRTFSAFLDFCYIVRRNTLTEDDLLQLQDALDWFHRYREIFKTTGVTLSFSLPRQHSLNHYLLLIRQFGAPNGICSSIMESKHIKAVKEPWCRSSRFKALGQMPIEGEVSETFDGPAVEAYVDLAATPCCQCDVGTLGDELELPNFQQLIQEFIHDQAHAADPNPPVFDSASAPLFLGKVLIFNSATASFYAPSDLSSTGGMRREHIHAVSSWRGGAPRHDCVFVNMNTDTDIMNGLAVAQVLCFFSFSNRTSFFQCAVVRWFSHVLGARDLDTGMYVVAPTTLEDNTPDISIIHIDCIFRAVHLIPVYGSNILPCAITSHDSYDVFYSYFVSKYADHHTFEIA
ncbi:uncharacterized protein F5147DRAFT_746079 [Suillus discolor]|uniref:Uncharacterized protein n=1 Tax=Suillus discolor TaxID=1912936 RepID=A0A9P7F551_9AGAM|nr:uncharacterized protein F5147DRAFT_746079 [Suillus discolor]KAG2107312.1 hypothetical protein F5147DRAFT_746079 [Suillus discolor]